MVGLPKTHTDERSTLHPLHVVMIGLIGAVVAGGCLLLSTPESMSAVDGAIEWHVDSPLRAVVSLLCCNYQLPTPNAGDIKGYVLGIGAGLALLALAVAVLARSTSESEDSRWDHANGELGDAAPASTRSNWRHMSPISAAQLFVGFYLLWSLASSRWSAAPELAFGASMLLAIHFFWSLGIGWSLNHYATRISTCLVVVVLSISSIVALWYFYGRNPSLRAKFPFGNPNFLSSCLIPGILLAIGMLIKTGTGFLRQIDPRKIAFFVCCILALTVMGWAFAKADSRGALAGLVAGLLALNFFSLRGKQKWLPVGLATIAIVVGALFYTQQRSTPSLEGRSATLRFREYAWKYAWQMFAEKPLTGHGQGGFTLVGDSYAVDDVLHDPDVFEARIAHAHNEWLETAADLGAVGVILLLAVIFMTFRAGLLVLRDPDQSKDRWVVIGLLSALVALIVEESFNVGLRVSGVPTLFYTILGLTWAICRKEQRDLILTVSNKSGWRLGAAAIGGTLGLLAMVVSQQDFDAARASYEARLSMDAGNYEEAIRHAESGVSRLNPQRALTGLVQLSQAHLLVADKLLRRAADRESRARQKDMVDQQLLALSWQDREQAEKIYCVQASQAIKDLITRAPGFLNHGRIEFDLNLLLAEIAAAHNDQAKYELDIANAATAINRELQRQPFNPMIALDYLRVAAADIDPSEGLIILARPLRYYRISANHVGLLTQLAGGQKNRFDLDAMEFAARELCVKPTTIDEAGRPVQHWCSEKLRLIAAVRFSQGAYDDARKLLVLAATWYENNLPKPTIGMASCYAELADSQFYLDPNTADQAIELLKNAIASLPTSWKGRGFENALDQRLVTYLLADAKESAARDVLRNMASKTVSEEIISEELGRRYRKLCESLLSRREAHILRKSADEILTKLVRWINRAAELIPDDYATHFIAADLAFHNDAFEVASSHLQKSLALGLPSDAAVRFLDLALEKQPECEVLREIRAKLPATKVAPPEMAPPIDLPARSDNPAQ